MRNLSKCLVAALLAQASLAEASGGVRVMNPAVAPIAVLGKLASDLMWTASRGGTCSPGRGAGKQAKADTGSSRAGKRRYKDGSEQGASSAGSGAGAGGQPPNGPGNGPAATDDLQNKKPSELLALLEELLMQMRAQGIALEHARMLLDRVNVVADAYLNNQIIRMFGFMGNGVGRANALREEAQGIVNGLMPPEPGRLTRLEDLVQDAAAGMNAAAAHLRQPGSTPPVHNDGNAEF